MFNACFHMAASTFDFHVLYHSSKTGMLTKDALCFPSYVPQMVSSTWNTFRLYPMSTHWEPTYPSKSTSDFNFLSKSSGFSQQLLSAGFDLSHHWTPWHLLCPELLNSAIISMPIFCYSQYWQLCKCRNSISFIYTSPAVSSSMLVYKMHIIIEVFLSKFWSRFRKTVEEFLASERVALPRSDVTGSWRAILYTIRNFQTIA